MTQVLGSRQDKIEVINDIEKILNRHIVVGLTPNQVAEVRAHIAWLRAQTAELRVNCRLETVPELQMTRITLELAFAPIPAMKQ